MSSGSVDEKYQYLNENIRNKYPYKTILIMNLEIRLLNIWIMVKLVIITDSNSFFLLQIKSSNILSIQ